MLEQRRLLATINVDDPFDVGDVVDANDGFTSLREAIIMANSLPGPDEIVLDAGDVYPLNIVGSGENASQSGDLDITDDVVIRSGLGTSDSVINATGLNDRIFDLLGGANVTLQGITLRGGTAGDGSGIAHHGTGTLTLENVTIESNTGTNRGGGLFVDTAATANVTGSIFSNNRSAFGGAIYNQGTLTVDGSSIASNSANVAGGGIHAQEPNSTTVVTTSLFSSNETQFGGAIANINGTVSVANSTISGNTSSSLGGGIFSTSDFAGNVARTVITQSTIVQNSSGGGGAVHSGTQNGATAGDISIGNSIVGFQVSGQDVTRFNQDTSSGATVTSLGNNLTDGNGNALLTQAAGDLIFVTVPVIDLALADNLGSVRTHALVDAANNPAINGGDNNKARNPGPDGVLDGSDPQLAVDGRSGFAPRLIGTVDIGAFESPDFDANDFIVTVTDDDGIDVNDNDVTLREAIVAANLTPGAQEITFASSVASSGPATIGMNGTEFSIIDDLTITGPGAKLLTIDGNLQSRIFNVDDGDFDHEIDVSFSGLTLTRGNANNPDPVFGSDNSGGGISSLENVTITDSVITGNTANFVGGGLVSIYSGLMVIRRSTISGNMAQRGGGVANRAASLEIHDSTITGNTAEAFGSGVYSFDNTGVANSTITGNIGPQGIFASGSFNLTSSIVAGNRRSQADGGGPSDLGGTFSGTHNLIGDPNSAGGFTHGIGNNIVGQEAVAGRELLDITRLLEPLADNGGPTPTHALVAFSPALNEGLNPNNSTTDQRGVPFARNDGGGVDIGAFERQDLVLVVTTADDELDTDLSDPNDLSLREAIDLANINPGDDTITFAQSISTINLTMGELLVSHSITIDGPGADLLTINGPGESATELARIFNFNGPGGQNFHVNGVTLSDGNVGSIAGGAIEVRRSDDQLEITNSQLSNNIGDGAVSSSGRLTIRDSAIVNNRGAFAGGVSLVGNQGLIENVTISGNIVTNNGAGIRAISFTDQTTFLTVRNSTITNNSAPLAANVLAFVQGGISSTIEFESSIVSNAQGGGENFFANNGSSIISLGNNIWDDTSGPVAAMGDQANTDPQINPTLALNGGTTLNHLPLLGGRAIDNGSNPSNLTGDQRGAAFPRSIGGGVDVGAIELQSMIEPTPTFVVTTTDDELNFNNTQTSLREALSFVATNPGVEEITFAESVTANGPVTILLELGELTINGSVTITGPGANLLRIHGDNLSRIFNVDDGDAGNQSDVMISGLTLTGGNAADDGGAINTVEHVTITDSVITGNSAANLGGGLASFANQGSLTIIRSTLSGNTTGGFGGGLASNDRLDIRQSTITGNTAAGNGSALYGGGFNVSTITGSTIAGNVGSEAIFSFGQPITLNSTIVAGNRTSDGTLSNIARTVDAASSNNLIGVAGNIGISDDTNGNLVGVDWTKVVENDGTDPILKDNGGRTPTIALIVNTDDPTRDAIDAGSNPDNETTDQRGAPFRRDDGGGVDIGAFERQTLLLVVTTADDELDADLSDLNDLSLREAIDLANSVAGADTITFDPSISTITLTMGELVVDGSVFIDGPTRESVTIDAGGNSRVFSVASGDLDVQLSGLVITGGNAPEFNSGGGIYSASSGTLTITDSRISGNSGRNGGGVFSLGDVVIQQSTVDGNSASYEGGGVRIANVNKGLTLTGSTISANRASYGGGISTDQLTISNSTITGNTANSQGGGIFTYDGDATISNSTITLNHAVGDGGGIRRRLGIVNNPPVTLHNTIVAGNTSGTSERDVSANVDPTSAFNLIGDGTGLSGITHDDLGNQIGTDTASIIPLLGPLANHGGPTQTHRLLQGSPAIDSGDPNAVAAQNGIPEFDQRGDGFTRVSDGDGNGTATIDVGAVEFVFVPNQQPSFTIDSPVTVNEDSGPQSVSQFASNFNPGPGEDGASTNSQVLHDEGINGTANPLSADNTNPTDVGKLAHGSNIVRGFIESALSVGNVDVFTFTIDPGFQLDGLFVLEYEYITPPPGNERAAFLAIDDSDTFPYNAQDLDLNSNPFLDETLFIGGTIFGLDDLPGVGGGDILPRAGVITGSGFTAPLPAGTYTIYIQQTGPANTYALDFQVTETSKQSLVAYTVSNVSDPSLFASGPLIDNDGTLRFTPAADASGTATFDVTAQDNGGTVNGGIDTSEVVVGTININEINDDDFGDAPSEYPVTLADNGARHTITSLFLGASVDDESDGQPSAAADSDNNDDGVIVIADIVAVSATETTSSFTVIASQPGRLDAWIDFGGNGNWTDAGDQIAASFALIAGSNTLSYPVPGNAVAGTTAARFRLSTAGGLAPTGDASNGEVEDYIATILDGSIAPDANVDLPGGDALLVVSGGQIVVRGGGADLFSAPAGNLGALNVNATDADETINLDSSGGSVVPAGGLNLDGGGGANTLGFVGGASDVDLTGSGMISAQNFTTIDLGQTNANVITINAASVQSLSPLTNTVAVVGGQSDAIVFEDAADWLMGPTSIVNGRFIRSVVRTPLDGGTETLTADLPHGWQNLVRASDVNNSGDVTSNDALVIINQLRRRNFLVDLAGTLQDPVTVASWPDIYYDQNGDDKATALDALRVINELRRISAPGPGPEAETIAFDSAIVDLFADGNRAAKSGIETVETPRVSQERVLKSTFLSRSDEHGSTDDRPVKKERSTDLVLRELDDLLSESHNLS